MPPKVSGDAPASYKEGWDSTRPFFISSAKEQLQHGLVLIPFVPTVQKSRQINGATYYLPLLLG